MSVEQVDQTDELATGPAPAVQLTGERKPVTAIFADVVGSTTLAEQLDPEDYTDVINEAYRLMSEAVQRYEGTVAQLQGDGLLALFGAPIAHEDDPERAVRAAIDMVAAIDRLAPRMQVKHGIDFRIRAGINSGPAVVGTVGSAARTEYTALGDAINVASRAQNAAEPGSVVVTEMTQRFIAPVFDFDDLGQIPLKGKSEPVRLFRVRGLRAQPGLRRGLASVGLTSPLVGRGSELATLTELYDVVRAGRGRVAVVLGEPGIGKSRLLAEMRAALGGADSGPTWIEGRCVSYGRGVPYHLVLGIVHTLLDIPLGAGVADVRTQLDQRLAELLGDDADDIKPYLVHLLGLSLVAAEAERVQFEPERLQSRYVASIHRLLRSFASNRPVTLVCEDIHWADPASVDTLLALLPLITAMPVLVVLAGRAEADAPGWRLVAHARASYGEALTEVRLQPLTESDSRALVANLLEIESLPDAVRDGILARAEGNPFFVEEIIRMLIERGAVVARDNHWVATKTIGAVTIPDTLHGLLLARIDGLPAAAKHSLRVASVIGRQFPVRVLERVLDG